MSLADAAAARGLAKRALTKAGQAKDEAVAELGASGQFAKYLTLAGADGAYAKRAIGDVFECKDTSIVKIGGGTNSDGRWLICRKTGASSYEHVGGEAALQSDVAAAVEPLARAADIDDALDQVNSDIVEREVIGAPTLWTPQRAATAKYKKGARVPCKFLPNVFWINTVDDNQNDPDDWGNNDVDWSTGSGWVLETDVAPASARSYSKNNSIPASRKLVSLRRSSDYSNIAGGTESVIPFNSEEGDRDGMHSITAGSDPLDPLYPYNTKVIIPADWPAGKTVEVDFAVNFDYPTFSGSPYPQNGYRQARVRVNGTDYYDPGKVFVSGNAGQNVIVRGRTDPIPVYPSDFIELSAKQNQKQVRSYNHQAFVVRPSGGAAGVTITVAGTQDAPTLTFSGTWAVGDIAYIWLFNTLFTYVATGTVASTQQTNITTLIQGDSRFSGSSYSSSVITVAASFTDMNLNVLASGTRMTVYEAGRDIGHSSGSTLSFDPNIEEKGLSLFDTIIEPTCIKIIPDPVFNGARDLLDMRVLPRNNAVSYARSQLQGPASYTQGDQVDVGFDCVTPYNQPDFTAGHRYTLWEMYGPPFGGNGPFVLRIYDNKYTFTAVQLYQDPVVDPMSGLTPNAEIPGAVPFWQMDWSPGQCVSFGVTEFLHTSADSGWVELRVCTNKADGYVLQTFNDDGIHALSNGGTRLHIDTMMIGVNAVSSATNLFPSDKVAYGNDYRGYGYSINTLARHLRTPSRVVKNGGANGWKRAVHWPFHRFGDPARPEMVI